MNNSAGNGSLTAPGRFGCTRAHTGHSAYRPPRSQTEMKLKKDSITLGNQTSVLND
jgi:hypothetical protein